MKEVFFIFLFLAISSCKKNDRHKISNNSVQINVANMKADWECYQSSPSKVPEKKQIIFSITDLFQRIDKERGGLVGLDPKELEDILSKVDKNSGLDYSKCASVFVGKIQEQLYSICSYVDLLNIEELTQSEINQFSKKDGSYQMLSQYLKLPGESCIGKSRTLLRSLKDVESEFYAQEGLLPPFAPGKDSSPSLTDREIRELSNKLKTDCTGSENDGRYLGKKMIKALEVISADIQPECQSQIADYYFNLLDDSRSSLRLCSLEDKDCRKKVIQRDKAVANVLVKLGKLGLSPTSGSESFYSQVQEESKVCELSDWSLRTLLSNNFNSFVNDFQCKQLTSGEDFVVNGDQGSGTKSKYTLRRIDLLDPVNNPDPVYEATLNLNFTGETDQVEQIRERTKTCLQESNEKMTGPNNARLVLKLFEDNSSVSRPPEHSIEVGAINRSNSRFWDFQVECPTILHEIFHVMGLADSYKETSKGYSVDQNGNVYYTQSGAENPRFNCRITEPYGSIMSGPRQLYELVFPRENTVLCYCPHIIIPELREQENAHSDHVSKNVGKNQCQEELNLLEMAKQESPFLRCPEHTSPFYITKTYNGIGYFSENFLNNAGEGVRNIIENPLGHMKEVDGVKRLRYKKNQANKKSILEPMHFNSIVQPRCKIANKVYYKCAPESRKSNFEEELGDQIRNDSCDQKTRNFCEEKYLEQSFLNYN